MSARLARSIAIAPTRPSAVPASIPVLILILIPPARSIVIRVARAPAAALALAACGLPPGTGAAVAGAWPRAMGGGGRPP